MWLEILWVVSALVVIVSFAWQMEKVKGRVERLETVFKQLGPTAEARLQENGTKVVMPSKWYDDMEES